MLEQDNVRNGFIEQSDYERLRAKLPEYLVPLLVVGYHVGCRLGELLKLQWEQVDFKASQIRSSNSFGARIDSVLNCPFVKVNVVTEGAVSPTRKHTGTTGRRRRRTGPLRCSRSEPRKELPSENVFCM
jgi:integrase